MPYVRILGVDLVRNANQANQFPDMKLCVEIINFYSNFQLGVLQSVMKMHVLQPTKL